MRAGSVCGGERLEEGGDGPDEHPISQDKLTGAQPGLHHEATEQAHRRAETDRDQGSSPFWALPTTSEAKGLVSFVCLLKSVH